MYQRNSRREIRENEHHVNPRMIESSRLEETSKDQVQPRPIPTIHVPQCHVTCFLNSSRESDCTTSLGSPFLPSSSLKHTEEQWIHSICLVMQKGIERSWLPLVLELDVL